MGSTTDGHGHGSRLRWITHRGAVGLAVAGLILFSFVSSQASARTPEQPTNSGQNTNSFAAKVNTLGRLRFPASFVGTSMSAGGVLVIHTTGSTDGELRAAVARLGHRFKKSYSFVRVIHGWSQLEKLTARIAADTKWQRDHKIQLAQWGPDSANGRVIITLQRYTSLAAREIVSRYGAGWVTVSTNSMSRLPQRFSDRFNDTMPWYGGDNLYFGSEQPRISCSSGFAYSGNNTGNTYVFTAGHCATSGTKVYTHLGDKYSYGTIGQRIFVDGGLDIASMAEYPAGASPIVWTGPTPTGGEYHSDVDGIVFPGDGENDIVFDGAKSGQVKGVTQDWSDRCVKFGDGITTCHLDKAHKYAINVCQGGDSGGPVYTFTDSSKTDVAAAGIIVGGTGSNDVCYYQAIFNAEQGVNGSVLTR